MTKSSTGAKGVRKKSTWRVKRGRWRRGVQKLPFMAQASLVGDLRKLDKVKHSFSAASAVLGPQLGITGESVRHRYERLRKHLDRNDPRQLLSNDDELVVCLMAEEHALSHHALLLQDIVDIVHELRPDLSNKTLRGWKRRFLKRHSDRLTLTSTKSIDPARVNPSTLCAVNKWVKWCPEYLKTNGLSSEWMVNTDETRLGWENKHQRWFKIELAGNMAQKGDVSAAPDFVASYLPFVAANGTFIMDVFVIPTRGANSTDLPLDELIPATTRAGGPLATYFVFSSTGYLKGGLWLPILQMFKAEMTKLQPGIDPTLLIDNASPHRPIAALRWAVKNKVHLIFLPAHCTHFLQPLDDAIFAQFKGILRSLMQKKFSRSQDIRPKIASEILKVAATARQFITPHLIKTAFKDVGIHPWDASLIVTHAKANIGILPTSPTTVGKLVDRARSVLLADTRGSSISEPKPHRSVKFSSGNEDKVFSSEELLQLQEAKEHDAQKQAAVKAEKKNKVVKRKLLQAEQKKLAQARPKIWRCQGTKHSQRSRPKWDEESPWLWCSSCEDFGLCPSCAKETPEILEEHEKLHSLPVDQSPDPKPVGNPGPPRKKRAK